jgi:hypothetical protein
VRSGPASERGREAGAVHLPRRLPVHLTIDIAQGASKPLSFSSAGPFAGPFAGCECISLRLLMRMWAVVPRGLA